MWNGFECHLAAVSKVLNQLWVQSICHFGKSELIEEVGFEFPQKGFAFEGSFEIIRYVVVYSMLSDLGQ